MTQSQEAPVVDAVIANAVHHAKLRATPDDVAFGLLHALRLLRDHAEALGASTVGRIDDAVRAQVLAESLQRRAINPRFRHAVLAQPGPTAYPAMEILGDAALTCLLLESSPQTPTAMNRAAHELVEQLREVLGAPPCWSDVDDMLRGPDADAGESTIEEMAIWLH